MNDSWVVVSPSAGIFTPGGSWRLRALTNAVAAAEVAPGVTFTVWIVPFSNAMLPVM